MPNKNQTARSYWGVLFDLTLLYARHELILMGASP